MMRYSNHPRDRILVESYRFLSFAKNMSKNIGQSISKDLSGKYSQKPLYHSKQFATDAHKTASKKQFKKQQ